RQRESLAAQRHHRIPENIGRGPGRTLGPGAPVSKALPALVTEAAQPLVRSPHRNSQFLGHLGLRAAGLDPLHKQLSTGKRQPRILMHVHSGLLCAFSRGKPKIHRRPPNGQPFNQEQRPEISQLGGGQCEERDGGWRGLLKEKGEPAFLVVVQVLAGLTRVAPGFNAGGSSLYTTGVTSRASSVEAIRPPMIVQAIGEYRPEPCTASGSRPPMAVAEVSRMGRKRISPACSMASSSGTPCWRSWFVKSTSRMEFLISYAVFCL